MIFLKQKSTFTFFFEIGYGNVLQNLAVLSFIMITFNFQLFYAKHKRFNYYCYFFLSLCLSISVSLYFTLYPSFFFFFFESFFFLISKLIIVEESKTLFKKISSSLTSITLNVTSVLIIVGPVR